MSPGCRKRFAAAVKIPRSTDYAAPHRRTDLDAAAVQVLHAAHEDHPLYGVRRLAIHLGWSINKSRRIRCCADIHIERQAKKHRAGQSRSAEIAIPQNELAAFATFKDGDRPQDGMVYAGMTGANA